MAAVVEFIHTATLLHDDVVDDSNLRRGFFSINALWKNKIAVLVGDYLLSRGLLMSVEKKEFEDNSDLKNEEKSVSDNKENKSKLKNKRKKTKNYHKVGLR